MSCTCMSPFEAYKLYLALKQHFTTPSYDFFKYNGKVRATEHSFETRKDKYMFYKLSKRDDPLHYLVSILSDEPNVWVGEIFDPKYEAKYKEFLKKKESLTYTFKNELDLLLEDFEKNFEVVDGDYPYLLKLYTRKKISKETFIIMNDCVRFFAKWNEQINDHIFWPIIAHHCKKFYPFMSYERDKYCAMLKDKFS